MINKILILTTLLILSASSLACEVILPSHLVILGNTTNYAQSMANSECSGSALNEVYETLQAVEGTIASTQLEEILKAKSFEVLIKPHQINVQHIKHLVREQLVIPEGIQLRSTEAVNSPNFLSIAPGDKLVVQCINCLFGDQQNLNITVNGFDGLNKIITIKADFKKMVRAYKVIGSYPAFSDITSSSLLEEYVESIPHTDLISNLDNLKFYKLNKPIRNGEFLKKSDLNAIDLVKAGVNTQVIIENEHVRLKTQGIGRSSGSIGEFVEVYHPQKNKKYFGKVIDINKVLVEL